MDPIKLVNIISQIPSRPISDNDPKPMYIEQESRGDLVIRVNNSNIICQYCLTNVQERYYKKHLTGGACERRKKKRES